MRFRRCVFCSGWTSFWAGLLMTATPANAESPVANSLPIERPTIVVSQRAKEIHASAPVIDGHNDLPWALREVGGLSDKYDIAKSQPGFHTDIPRLRTGGVGAQFWSVYVPASTRVNGESLQMTLEQIRAVRQMIERYDKTFALALSTSELERIRGEGKIASMIGIEGGHSIENSLNVLRQLYLEGARYMTLTHSETLEWADSCTGEPTHGGLAPFGEEVVAEMNRLGMIVDISHVSADCMRDVLRITKAPVIFSHSSAMAIADHPRNVPDDVLKQMPANGGVVMINFYNSFVHPQDAALSKERYAVMARLKAQFPTDEEKVDSELKRWDLANPNSKDCDVYHVLDHIEHVIRVAGINHVGVGGDYDGIGAVPKQLEDVSTYPVLTQALLDRGYSESDIRKFLGGNILRVFKNVESVAETLK